MNRPPAWLLRRRRLARKPQPVTTEFYWCQPAPGDVQFSEWLKKAIRRGPGGGTRFASS